MAQSNLVRRIWVGTCNRFPGVRRRVRAALIEDLVFKKGVHLDRAEGIIDEFFRDVGVIVDDR